VVWAVRGERSELGLWGGANWAAVLDVGRVLGREGEEGWAERSFRPGWVFLFLLLSLSISISTPLNLLNSNSNLNSTLALK